MGDKRVDGRESKRGWKIWEIREEREGSLKEVGRNGR